MKQVGIIGGAGYTAGELIRILLNHKEVAIKYVYSTTNAGNKVSAVHQDLVGDTDLIFSSKINSNVDERYHLELSTHVACNYILKAKEKFGDWTLAAAAYNAGIRGISNQLEKQQPYESRRVSV